MYFNQRTCLRHPGQEVLWICTQEDCSVHFVCGHCILEYHSQHVKKVLLYQEFCRVVTQVQANELLDLIIREKQALIEVRQIPIGEQIITECYNLADQAKSNLLIIQQGLITTLNENVIVFYLKYDHFRDKLVNRIANLKNIKRWKSNNIDYEGFQNQFELLEGEGTIDYPNKNQKAIKSIQGTVKNKLIKQFINGELSDEFESIIKDNQGNKYIGKVTGQQLNKLCGNVMIIYEDGIRYVVFKIIRIEGCLTMGTFLGQVQIQIPQKALIKVQSQQYHITNENSFVLDGDVIQNYCIVINDFKIIKNNQNEMYSFYESIRLEGQMIQNELNGYGSIKQYYQGQLIKYIEGTFLNNKITGKGFGADLNPFEYKKTFITGQLNNGLLHGDGYQIIHQYADIKDCNLITSNEYRSKFDSCLIQVGQFQKGQLCGSGLSFEFTNGLETGQFKLGQLHNEGSRTSENILIKKGYFADGLLIQTILNSVYIYEYIEWSGQIVNGLFDGDAQMNFKNGFENLRVPGRIEEVRKIMVNGCYLGKFKNNLLNGIGEQIVEKNQLYTHQLEQTGFGDVFDCYEYNEQGNYVDNALQGDGLKRYSGRVTEGKYVKGQLVSESVTYECNQEIQSGVYEGGIYIGRNRRSAISI